MSASLPGQLLVALVVATPFFVPASATAQYPGVQGSAQAQVARSSASRDFAQGMIDKGTTALAAQDYESAFAFFKSAVDSLPTGGSATEDVRAAALLGFSDAAVKLAQQRISEGRFEDAKTTVAVVLEDRYDPTYKPAIALNDRLKDRSSYFSQTMTPSFVANVEEVKQLLQEAQGFYASGRYDLAFKRYEQVLNVDRYNIAARRGMEQVNVARAKYADTAYSETRGDMLRQVSKAWELPVRKFDIGASTIIDQPQIDTRGTAVIIRKLDEIIIPRIDFRDATVREALDFIRQRAAALDTLESDPTRKGVNVVLKLPPDSPEAATRITLSLTDIPLRAAIDYVARAANLKLKVEPFAVKVVRQSEPIDVLVTKEYKVPPSFITALPASSITATAGGGSNVAAGSQPSIAARSGAREFLENSGVTFPEGASANYIASTSRLIVKNTQANLDLVDALVDNSLTSPESQVEIESKFLEITQNNLKELGFDWLVGQFALPGGTGFYGAGGTTPGGTTIGDNSFPLLNPNGTPVGASSNTQGPITAGNRSGTSAIGVNAIDGLLFGSPIGPAPALLSIAGIFTNPQFQVVLRALSQSKGVDLVTSPRVTTKSGQKATIEIVREFLFPSEYDLPQVSAASGSTFTPVIPTTPTAFEMRPVGVTLEVEPTVGPDGYTIELRLAPRVTEFDGFINYGSPINASVAGILAILPGPPPLVILGPGTEIVATENVINQPVFSVREVTTQVSVVDGQTVVLGGLMREDVQKVEDKVPIIGDIPLIGRLFRSSSDQHFKRNLIIFVTVGLLDPAGQPLIRADEEGEVIAVPNASGIMAESIVGDPLSVPLPQ